ncbi:MAG: HD domain-containing protein [Candidatus Hydrogenedentes bacterium]|nr:HD domain-containing protein [Candidatus Hydrogenedentota bacterium]
MPEHLLQIRDPVHNFIKLTSKESRLLDTQAFQRLRGIKQLALACLVYPGALHTRFDHSLGVMHVAGKMAKTLGFDDDGVELVRLAALLHDVGHGPFSHVSEHALERFGDRSKVPENQKMEKIHELVTARIIQEDSEISSILGQHKCADIVSLLSEGHGEPALRAVVSGPLDADKQDYLLRDSYFCGVRYGIFDLEQLHRSIEAPRHHGTRELMLNSDGIHAVEQYVLAKYYMTTNVYRHKVRLITDQMIVRAIALGIEQDRIDELSQLYTFDNSIRFIADYRKWDDARFMRYFGDEKFCGKLCHELLCRLQRRELLKRVFQGNVKDFAPGVREPLSELSKSENANRRREVEGALANQIAQVFEESVNPEFVILHTFGIKSVKEMSRNDEAGMLVWSSPDPIYFEQKSSLFASIQEGFDEEYVEIYAPVTWPSRDRRADLCERLKPLITEELERVGNGTEEGKRS